MLVTSEKPGKAFEQKKILTTKISSLRHFSHIAGLPEPNTCLLPENNAVLEKKHLLGMKTIFDAIPIVGSCALCVLFYAAFKTRCFRSGKPPRPYMERLIDLSLLIFPSTGPLLYGRVKAA
jgi:hypothetical protein